MKELFKIFKFQFFYKHYYNILKLAILNEVNIINYLQLIIYDISLSILIALLNYFNLISH